ncbi:RNA polymerase sigma factor (sigma-70 family) [Cytobacillus horneckiae]|uniref:sigma-70 family RNA polymerase sigma factor n=1 Tax=Cytobacillus horneckiae TaxID=549687 RepID=UPI0019D2A870|nr:sigma-70 family RNA polymerase sigma factor [Cytobacillus horneckiae]MBN6887005.1 sigma-70 family RNA polymerase sigma factor [Cytobacillus horneckiae]
MNWTRATDEQLLLIVKEDKECPSQLLSGVVHESLSRGLFDNLVYWIFKSLTKGSIQTMRAWSIDTQDIISIGYCGVLNALDKWSPGKTSFKSFAYMNIRSEFTHLMDQENAKKREINKVTYSYDAPTKTGSPILFYLTGSEGVEQQVIRSIEYQSKMNHLDIKEQQMISLFLQGYRFREIKNKLYKHLTISAVSEKFYEVINKLNIKDFQIDVKKSENKSQQQKLTEEMVMEIREGKRKFKTKQEEADFYGVSRRLIYRIRKNTKLVKEGA